MKISKKVLATLLSSLIIATTITPITASAEEQQPTESSSENIILSDIETESSTANNVFTDESNKQDTSVTSQAVNDITESNKNLAGIITFEIPDNWRNNNRFYYAHIWNGLPEGEGLYEWQSSSELMTVNLDETKATYNIPQGDWNLIIISGDSGIQTFDTVFNQNCIGDTCYIDEEKFEDPAIYGKALTALLWKNNPDCGPHKMVTSLGKVVGFSYLPGETDQDLYNNFVNLYGDDSKQWESTVGVQAGITWEEAKIKVATELGLVNEVTSVQLNKTALTLGVGETTTLTATTIPSNSSSTYIWSSNNVNVATVNSNGKITAKSSGTATITVKTNNGKTATCKVTVKPAPTSVKVSATSKTLGVGETFIISESTNSGSYASTFTWSSSNNNVATVKKTTANKAMITAKGVGTANITIKTYNGKTATCKVTVKPAPTSVKVSATNKTLGVGETFIISESTNSGSYASTFTWSSSNNNVATVKKTTANKAMITAKGVGTANITIKTYNGKTATCKVTVKPAPTSVKVSATSKTLGVGETFIISESTNSGSYASTFTWSSSNNNVATVKKTTANKAMITAKGVGTANITIKTYNGKTATCKVTVKPAPTSVKVSATSKTLGVGETFIISESTNSGSYASTFTWSSSNNNVATVKKTTANKAMITAKGVGTANITIKTYNGKTATCKITVKKAPSSVSLITTFVDINVGQSYIIAQSTNSGSYASTFTWSSSNNSVATVKKTTANKAIIVGKNVGTATITIKTYNGKTATCEVTVTKSGYSYAHELVHTINRERYYAEVEQIPINNLACDVANIRAKELVQKFDPVRPDGSYINKLATDMGLDYEYIIELYVYQEPNVSDVELCETLVSIGEHYELLTLNEIKSIGVGKYLASDGNTYWSILYII